jgi:hypothetical protein
VEENLFRATYEGLRRRECPFERAILRGCCACPLSRRLHVGERLGVGCRDGEASRRCLALFAALRHNARFALRLSHPEAPLPHGKRIKVECGGLLGLARLLEPTVEPPVRDIHAVVEEALSRYETLEEIPYQRLMPEINAFRGRPPRHRGS